MGLVSGWLQYMSSSNCTNDACVCVCVSNVDMLPFLRSLWLRGLTIMLGFVLGVDCYKENSLRYNYN